MFSITPIDQTYEQNNDLVKSSGCAVGLTEENPSAFKKWIIAEPEEARLLKEFEQEYNSEDSNKQWSTPPRIRHVCTEGIQIPSTGSGAHHRWGEQSFYR